jgi:hypothetical protein
VKGKIEDYNPDQSNMSVNTVEIEEGQATDYKNLYKSIAQTVGRFALLEGIIRQFQQDNRGIKIYAANLPIIRDFEESKSFNSRNVNRKDASVSALLAFAALENILSTFSYPYDPYSGFNTELESGVTMLSPKIPSNFTPAQIRLLPSSDMKCLVELMSDVSEFLVYSALVHPKLSFVSIDRFSPLTPGLWTAEQSIAYKFVKSSFKGQSISNAVFNILMSTSAELQETIPESYIWTNPLEAMIQRTEGLYYKSGILSAMYDLTLTNQIDYVAYTEAPSAALEILSRNLNIP